MTRFDRLNRWLTPPIMAVLLATNVVPRVFADSSSAPPAAPSCNTERGRPSEKPPPPGQLTRRGVVGEIVEVITDDGSTTRIVIETQFGNVEMTVPEDFDGSLEEGSRIAALMEKEPITTDSTSALSDTPFRVADASRITVVPKQATRSHHRAVVQSEDDGTLEVIDEDGVVSEVEVTGEGGVQTPPEEPTPEPTATPEPTREPTATPEPTPEPTATAEPTPEPTATPEPTLVPTATPEPTLEPTATPEPTREPTATPEPTPEPTATATPTSGTTGSDGTTTDLTVEQEQVEEGTDVVLLTQCTGQGATPQVRSIQKADRVIQRLERLQAKFEDSKPELAAKFADLQEKKQERQEARLQRMAEKAPPEARGKAEKALRKAKGECPQDAEEECPEDGGSPQNSGRGQGGDQGNGDQGGGRGNGGQGGGQGNGGQGGGQGNNNQGGGQGDKDKDKDKD